MVALKRGLPALVLAVAGLCAVTTSATPASATAAAVTGSPAGSSGVLEVSSVSPWVEPEGTFTVTFAPSTAVPLDARFRFTLHQRLEPPEGDLSEAVDEVLAEGVDTEVLQAPQDFPVLLLGDPAAGLRLELPVRSGSGGEARLFVPTPGVHPVELQLISAGGDELWSSTVFLNRLPDEQPVGRDGAPAVMAVQLVTSIDSAPALEADGSVDLGAEELAAVSSLQELLGELVDLPLTVALRPNTAEAMARSGEAADAAFLEAAGSSTWTFSRLPYVRVDTTGLVQSGGRELERQVTVGDEVSRRLLGRNVDGTIWLLDDTVATRGALALSTFGVRHLLVSPDRVGDVGSARRATRVFDVAGVEDLTVSSYDGTYTRELLGDDDPALRAHRVSTRMLADWFAAVDAGPEAFPGVVTSVLIPPGSTAETVRSLAEPLLGDGPLQVRPFPTASADEDGAPLEARLASTTPAALGEVVARTTAVGRRIDGYRSMTTAQDPEAGTWDLVNDQAPALFIDDAERRRIWDAVNDQIDRRIEQVVAPPDRTVVLTSRAGSIPLRYRNNLAVPVRVQVRTRAARLEFPAGEVSEVVLAPGENRIDVPVVVRAPGSSPMRVELRSPDGALRLAGTTVTVRSSSISGVGAALSLVSLLFLGAWWVHTHRRRRA